MSRTAILVAILSLLTWAGAVRILHTKTPIKKSLPRRSALESGLKSYSIGYIDMSADDVTWFDFTPGKQLRMEGIEAFRNFLEPMGKEIPPHKYDLANPKVQLYGNTAILTYHWNASTPDGQQIPSWKATSVYNWKMEFSSLALFHCPGRMIAVR